MSGKKKLLLVDDEPEFLEALASALSGRDYEVTTARDGLDAQQRISGTEFRLIVSDVRMPRLSGVDLAKWVKQERLSSGLILMSGCLSSNDNELLRQLGCDALLEKPFDVDALVKALESVAPAGPSETPLPASDDARFGRVPMAEFLSGKKLLFPVYLRMIDGRFLKLAHSGEDIDQARILAWKAKGITELWLERADFETYFALNNKVLKLVVADPAASAAKRALVMRHAAALAAERMRVTGVSDSCVADAKQIFEQSLDLLTPGQEVTRLLESIQSQEQGAFAHAALCGMLCALLARIMGWSSKKNIMMLTMAGFLHDVGMLDLPAELCAKSPRRLTPDELEEYRRHPQLGAERLTAAGAPQEIVRIVLQHHEDVRGTGYPSRLTRTEIFPMSRIVLLVDQFCDASLAQPANRRVTASAVLDQLITQNRGAFDPSNVLALSLALQQASVTTAQQKYAYRATKAVG